MKTSVRWLNSYLDPADVSPALAEQLLTQAGFPIESAEPLPSGDTLLDVEVTSNRGDCFSHIGLAREISAATARSLRLPSIPASIPASSPLTATTSSASIESLLSIHNTTPDVCRLFTARVIRNVRVAPSPAWLVDALAAVGQRSINNIVDITNYVLFEFGQPTHVFDLAKLRTASPASPAKSLVIRFAHPAEPLTLLDGKKISLRPDELVVADGNDPGTAVSLAGIMGGLGSEVTEQTTDVVLEAATWDPVTIRRAARRLGLRTDASHRFERTVDPRTIDLAARRAAALILELAGPGATLHPAVLQAGATLLPPRRVALRIDRCSKLLGYPVPLVDAAAALRGLDITVSTPSASPSPILDCIIPPHRPDLEREVDLIEEVARTLGLARVPILDKIPVQVAEPQISERATRELTRALTSLGFFETVTFSFIAPTDAAPFCPSDLSVINLCDERRKADPTLRPSVIPSLLACRRANQDGGVTAPAGVRLFEIASVFAQSPPAPGQRSPEREARLLTLIADAAPVTTPSTIPPIQLKQYAVRLVRGALESVVAVLAGTNARLELIPATLPMTGFDPEVSAEVRLFTAPDQPSQRIGSLGVIAAELQLRYGLTHPVVAAEVDVASLLALFPPRSTVHALPAFPSIARDLSFIVSDSVSWDDIDRLITSAALDRLVGREFVTTFRGFQIGKGNKSVTVRLEFRDPARTLRHQEVDPQIASLVSLAAERLGAKLRA